MMRSGPTRFALLSLFLAVAFLRGSGAPVAHANPAKIWVINDNVASAIAGITPGAFDTAMTTSAGRAPYLAQFDAMQTGTDGEVALTAAIPYAGNVFIVVQTDGSGTNVSLNGRGLVCTPACDVSNSTPDPTDHIIAYRVTGTGTHTAGDAFPATAAQDAVTLDSRTINVVGQAHDLQLTASKYVVQEGLTQPTCLATNNTSYPASAAADTIFTDIDGTPLVGYGATWSSTATGTMVVAVPNSISMLQASGTTIAAANVFCGVSYGIANLQAANAVSGAIEGIFGAVTRTQTIAVTGVPASMALTASPSAIPCDGVNSSTVTANVKDLYGNNVADGTPVNFSVVALGTANPVNATTLAGDASSTITPLSAATSGVVVIVTSGNAQVSIRVDCALPPTTTPTMMHAASGGLTTTVQATLTGGQPNTPYVIDLFDNPACGAVSGGTFVAGFGASSDGAGNLRLTELISTYVAPGWVFQATATMPGSIASPMSACQTVIARACTDDTTCNGYTDAQKIALGKDPFTYCAIMRGDVNMDGKINILDLSAIAARYRQTIPPAPARLDQNADGKINIIDLAIPAAHYNQSVTACP